VCHVYKDVHASADLNDRSDRDNDPMPNATDPSNRYFQLTKCYDRLQDGAKSLDTHHYESYSCYHSFARYIDKYRPIFTILSPEDLAVNLS